MALTSSVFGRTSGFQGCQQSTPKRNREHNSAGATKNGRLRRMARASRTSETANGIEIQSGKAARRQAGSKLACQLATACAALRRTAVKKASKRQPVRMDAKPRGTTSESSGMMTMLADKPVMDSR